MKRIYVAGTADTKGAELKFLANAIAGAGMPVAIVDLGTRRPDIDVDIHAAQVANCHPHGAGAVFDVDDRGEAMAAMALAFTRFLPMQSDLAGIVGIGGGGGTSVVTAGMRVLPMGLPKIMVSTLASGDVSGFVGVSDIMMVPSLTDMTGLNRVSRVVLHNAAQAIAAMAGRPAPASDERPSTGLTMFGVTTRCVTAIIDSLQGERDCLAFHATGVGGRTMEKLVDSGLVDSVIDITTTEVCDLLLGGVLAASEDRFGAIARTGIPWVGSAGALDMVNFWAPETIPERYRGRTFYKHNANVTLMRTTAGEAAMIGRWIGERLNACDGPVRFLIPEKGVSALDIEGGPFFDPQADVVLFEALETAIEQTDRRRVIRLPHHINDPEFAAAAVRVFNEIAPA